MIWSHFLFEKLSFVDFQKRSEPYIAHGLGRGKKERGSGGRGRGSFRPRENGTLMSAILMKMAVLRRENAFCVATAMDLEAISYLKIHH